MTAKPDAKAGSERDPRIFIAGALAVLVFMAVGFSDVEKVYERHTTHEKLTVMRYHGEWSFGEYRECTSNNFKAEDKQPELDCTGFSASGTDKVFKVSFSGDLTYDIEKPESVVHHWMCRRNNGDPTYSCEAKESPQAPAQ